MKKKILLGVFLLLAAVVLFAQSGPVITVVNNCGYPIWFIYISPTGTDNWEEDVLGDDILQPGRSINVQLPRNGTWDFMAVDEDGDSYEVYEIRVPGTNRIVIQ